MHKSRNGLRVLNALMHSRIATESKRQTLDWSLALVSQGIECIIDQDADAGWGLLVEEKDEARAREVIRQFHAENSHWPWQQKIFTPALAFDWGSVAWVFLLCLFFGLSDRILNLRGAGIMNDVAVSRGEWWRLFTAIYLHADLAHLASNGVMGFVLLGLAMGRFGTGIGLMAAFLAGAFGNICSWMIYPGNHLGLGASGMVMGALGLLAAQSGRLLRQHPNQLRLTITGLAAGVMLFVLMGLSPGTDVVAHLGGFLAGVFLGSLLWLMPSLARSTAANLIAGGIFSALTIWTWWLAVKSTPKIL